LGKAWNIEGGLMSSTIFHATVMSDKSSPTVCLPRTMSV